MRYTPKQYAQALLETLESTSPSDIDKVLDNFTQVLVENNDLKLFEEISAEYEKVNLAAQGISPVKVSSAHNLNSDNEQAIIEILNKLIQGKPALRKSRDENLIGGAIIEVDDVRIDASVRNSLGQLKKEIIK